VGPLEWVGEQAESAWNTVSGAATGLWHHIVSFVHTVVHGAIGWVVGIFGVVVWAWNHLLSAATALWRSLENIVGEIAGWIVTFVTHTLPSIWRHIERVAQSAWHWVENAVKWASTHIARLAHTAWHWVENAVKWVVVHVARPIWAWIKHVGHQILEWAHFAWHLLTHPLQLAEVIFWPLWFFFEKVAWKVARKIGQWLAELVLHNLVRLVNLVEDIVAAVL
jgi:hypothetical protein